MKIKLIDFGAQQLPERAHDNDAGADVFATKACIIKPGEVVKMPLGFGLELPDGLAGFIYPRSSLSTKGIVCELPPIDSGYRGEIHAVITNVGINDYMIELGDRIGQLVVIPIILADIITEASDKRGADAFGSTGR